MGKYLIGHKGKHVYSGPCIWLSPIFGAIRLSDKNPRTGRKRFVMGDRRGKKVVREWLCENAWIYRVDDNGFLKVVEAKMRKVFGGGFRLWQNEEHFLRGHYPQYLCSADLKGIDGDTCHFWRDGQTWWPVAGDYTHDVEEKAELVLRECIVEFSKKRKRNI